MNLEWEEITQDEYVLKFNKLKETEKLQGHTVTVVDPPQCIIASDTGAKSFLEETWFLMREPKWGDRPQHWYKNTVYFKGIE